MAMLNYARTDSHYLYAIYIILANKLNEIYDNSENSSNKLIELAIECNELVLRKSRKSEYQKVKIIQNNL